MTSKTLFTASELESVGIFMDTETSISPYLIPLDDLESVQFGQEKPEDLVPLVLPDMDLFWRLFSQGDGSEDVAILDADEVLESEDSVEEDPEEEEEEEEGSAQAPDAGEGAKDGKNKIAKKPPKLPPIPAEDAVRSAPPPVPPALPPVPPLPSRAVEANWSDNFFDDDYVSTLDLPNSKRTRLEVDFIVSQLDLKPDQKVLDVGCSDGRHAVGLAQKKCQVMGIDTSIPFLLIANQMAEEMGVAATFVKKDMREYTPEEPQDALICYGGTFGYFTDEENLDLLRRFHAWLVPGGRFLLEVMHRDYIVSQLPLRIWWEGNGCMVMDECYFQYSENRLSVKRNAAFVSGKQRNYTMTVRAYTLREISDIVEAIGFKILTVSGCVYSPGAFTGMLSPSILLTLQKA